MNVEVRFKPGIRTSLNSSSNIKDNFGSSNGKGGVTQTRSSTASSAAANLANSSRSSGPWNSKSGSILFNAVRPSGGNNGRVDTNYVSAGRSQPYVRNKYSQMENYGYTRAENMTGYSRRGLQRLQDAAYGQGAYAANPYAELNNAQASGTDFLTTVTQAVQLGKAGFELGKTGYEAGKTIWDAISSKSSNSKGNVSDGAKSNIKTMKDAKDSGTLNTAIGNSKADLKSVEESIPTLEGELQDAQTKHEGLETTYNSAQDTYKNLGTQVNGQKETVNKKQGTFNQAKQSLSVAQQSLASVKQSCERILNDPNATEEQKALAQETIDNEQEKVDNLQKEVDKAQEELNTAKDELTKLEGDLKNAKTDMDNAKRDLDANQKVLDETPDKIKNAKAAVETYNKEIPNQEKRLEEMKKKEDEEFAKLASKDESKISEKDKTKRANLAKTIASRSSDDENTFEEIGGKSFAKIAGSDGKTIYLVDGAVKTEEEYNTAMAQAKNQPTIAEDTTINRYDDISGLNFA